jgi:hypothetical protein
MIKWIPGRISIFLGIMGLFLGSCGRFQEPEFQKIANLRLMKAGFKESSVLVDLHYFNPNRSRLKLQSAEGEAWLDEHYLGRFKMDTLIHILPKSEFILPVSLQVDMAWFLLNSATLLTGKEVKIKVTGTVRAGKSLVYVNYPILYEGKQDLSDLMKD